MDDYEDIPENAMTLEEYYHERGYSAEHLTTTFMVVVQKVFADMDPLDAAKALNVVSSSLSRMSELMVYKTIDKNYSPSELRGGH